MPEQNANTKPKHWYNKLWGKIVAFVAISSAVWGILESVYFFTEEWHQYQLLKTEVKKMQEEEQWMRENMSKLLQYVEDKKKSFAVGFRKVQVHDEETGKTIWKKRYRDWEGTWHDIFYDAEASRYYGVDYYYYIIDTLPPPNNQKYCW